MKKLVLLVVLTAFYNSLSFAQVPTEQHNKLQHSHQTDGKKSADSINHSSSTAEDWLVTMSKRKYPDDRAYETSQEFNNHNYALCVNDVFVKDWIGLPDSAQYAQKKGFSGIISGEGFKPFWIKGIGENNDSVYVEKTPININGVEYAKIIILNNHTPQDLLTLKQIKQEYYPDITMPCIFMIDKYFITRGIDEYKIERSMIECVELQLTTELPGLENDTPRAIIRIFTNTPRNHYIPRLR